MTGESAALPGPSLTLSRAPSSSADADFDDRVYHRLQGAERCKGGQSYLLLAHGVSRCPPSTPFLILTSTHLFESDERNFVQYARFACTDLHNHHALEEEISFPSMQILRGRQVYAKR